MSPRNTASPFLKEVILVDSATSGGSAFHDPTTWTEKNLCLASHVLCGTNILNLWPLVISLAGAMVNKSVGVMADIPLKIFQHLIRSRRNYLPLTE